jgi:hypothetical protein
MSLPVNRTSAPIAAQSETLAVAPARRWGNALVAAALAAVSILYSWPEGPALLRLPLSRSGQRAGGAEMRSEDPIEHALSHSLPWLRVARIE